jgi:hypothetical protein
MIKERLKEIDLKITDLSDYLKISRPTVYKFIEAYDAKDYETINKHVLELFTYIDKNPLVGKKATINYILTNLVDEKELGEEQDNSLFNQLKKILIANPDSKKSQFLKIIATKSDYDEICEYLVNIYPLLRKRNLSENEIELLKPYDEIRNILDKAKEN